MQGGLENPRGKVGFAVFLKVPGNHKKKSRENVPRHPGNQAGEKWDLVTKNLSSSLKKSLINFSGNNRGKFCARRLFSKALGWYFSYFFYYFACFKI